MTDRPLVLVVSADCRLCERARLLLRRLGIAFREVDLDDAEAAELAHDGVPVVFFPVLVDGRRVVAYGDISEAEIRRALEPAL
ncbi:MAG TPA: glutaredoxin domain-containing protein [Gaiellaceae bacterium]|nr:glutaredoxin domain-containing protein [Gaiellaceae bacterium]